MTDLSTLTDDEVAQGLGTHLREAERRLEAKGFVHYLKRMNAAHAVIQGVGAGLAAASQITPYSGGTPKE